MSQEAKMLKMLRKAGQRGVENYKFPANKILRYSARINDLRQDGYNILCERVRLPNGRATNIFRYVLVEEGRTPWWKLTREK